MKRMYIFCILLFGIGIVSCAIHNQKNTEVSFYLVNNKTKDDISKNDLSGAVLDKSPVFTTKDIIEYSQSEHTIKLTKEAFEKFKAIRWGKVFTFCVDNKPVYFGAVWGPYLSVSFNGVVATEHLYDRGNNKILISAGYPNEDIFSGIDPRQNKLVLDSLRKSNKLVK